MEGTGEAFLIYLSAKLYSETWSLNRHISDNGKQVYRVKDKRSILNRRGRSVANNIQMALTKEAICKHDQQYPNGNPNGKAMGKSKIHKNQKHRKARLG